MQKPFRNRKTYWNATACVSNKGNQNRKANEGIKAYLDKKADPNTKADVTGHRIDK